MNMETILENSGSSNLTIKLDHADRDRLKSLAIAKKRTAHYLMREAIQKYLATEETQQRFIEVAKNSLADYKKTGSHITLEEFSAWTKAIKTNPKTPMPECHK
jgi:predicted transcriptional regulator